MKTRLIFPTTVLAAFAVSCSQQAALDDYDVSNPYDAPGYVDEDATPYDPANPNPSYDAPAAYEDTAPARPSQPAPTPTRVHTVVRGDTLWGLSRKYGVSVGAIKRANNMTSDTIVLGKKLQIPGS